MGLSDSDTRAKLTDPAIHARGWTEDLIRREETAGAIEIIGGKARKQAKGRTDYTLRVKVNPDNQTVAVALIEAKAEHLPPTRGLEQGKAYASARRLSKDYERKVQTSETLIEVVMIRLLIARQGGRSECLPEQALT